MLIDLPRIPHLKVSEAVVRWATSDECGIEFLHVEKTDNCAFDRVTSLDQASLRGDQQVVGPSSFF